MKRILERLSKERIVLYPAQSVIREAKREFGDVAVMNELGIKGFRPIRFGHTANLAANYWEAGSVAMFFECLHKANPEHKRESQPFVRNTLSVAYFLATWVICAGVVSFLTGTPLFG